MPKHIPLRNSSRSLFPVLLLTLGLLTLTACGTQEAESRNASADSGAATGESATVTSESSTATNPFVLTSTTPVSIDEAIPGDLIELGSYEQDGDTDNGPETIEWQVLAAEEERILVISRYILDSRLYNDSQEEMTWETCSLRTWLNEGEDSFRALAFDEEERSRILSTDLDNAPNPQHATDAGSSTQDEIFCLSWDELLNLCGYDEAQIKKNTDYYYLPDNAIATSGTLYAKEQGLYEFGNTGFSWWWLRGPGIDRTTAMTVYDAGIVDVDGIKVDSLYTGVRPAMWLGR